MSSQADRGKEMRLSQIESEQRRNVAVSLCFTGQFNSPDAEVILRLHQSMCSTNDTNFNVKHDDDR